MVEFRPVGRVQVSLWGRKVGVLVPSPEHGFGNSLIRRWVRERKYDINELSALDKLCYVGNRTMGAFMMGDRDVPEN